MAKKFYAVRSGRRPGVYDTWDECKNQVHGFSGAIYKSFPDRSEAERYVSGKQGEFPEQNGDSEGADLPDGSAVAYVDGSYNVKTGEYSCGVVFLTDGEEFHLSQKGEDEELAVMRNVAGEILGAELAMKRAVGLGIQRLSIFHDYQGIASWCLGEWKTNREGTRAYKAYFDSIRDVIDIRFVKVKGHSGDKYNDMADQLAKQAIFE